MGAAPALRLQIVCKGNTFEKKDNRHKINCAIKFFPKRGLSSPRYFPCNWYSYLDFVSLR